jgi:hypothetical protein
MRLPCQSPAITDWTVGFHGAGGGGPKGGRNGAYKDGLHAAEALAERRAVAELVRRELRVGQTYDPASQIP